MQFTQVWEKMKIKSDLDITLPEIKYLIYWAESRRISPLTNCDGQGTFSKFILFSCH